jgi:hypothetical protein
MADIFDSSLNSGLQVGGDLAVDNDKNFATHGGVIANDNNGPAVIGTQGSTVAGDDLIQASHSTVLNNSSVDGGLASNNGDGIQVAPQGSDVGALNFGSGQATNVADSNLFGSTVGNSGPVQQIEGNSLGDGAALGGRDAVAHNDFSVDASTHNLSSINGDHNTAAVDHSAAFADNSEHTDVTNIEDSFKSFEDNTHVSNHEQVISHSNVADHGGDLDFDF